jgi:hypothetical protein
LADIFSFPRFIRVDPWLQFSIENHREPTITNLCLGRGGPGGFAARPMIKGPGG